MKEKEYIKICKEVREYGEKELFYAHELRSKFFFHWAILSVAIITLIIPLLLEVKKTKEIENVHNIKITLILLLATVIFSSIINYLNATQKQWVAFANIESAKGEKEKSARLYKKQNVVRCIRIFLEIVSIVIFVLALSSLYLFLNNNIF